jgi:alkylation response protein AidB-like acyl-CoA dehydrogenase
MTAEYTSTRQQFGRPLSTNQGVALRAADAFIDIRAIDATLWQAAWRIDEGLDATRAAMVAKWWASDGGQRVVHATQHLHGGMGADIDYPIHRYFLWGKTIEQTLGGPALQLATLGRELAEATA